MLNTEACLRGWHRRTKLLLMLLGSSLILGSFPITTARNVMKTSYVEATHLTNTDSSVCASSSCKKTAERMVKSLNEKQDPCNDFYEFACGGWIAGNSNDSHYGSLGAGIIKAHLTIKNLLESNTSYSSSAVNKARTYYNSCIKQKDKKEIIPKVLLEVIEEIGDWHLLPNTKVKNQNIDLPKLLLVVNNRCHDNPLLFDWNVDSDDFTLIVTKEGIYNDNDTIIIEKLIKICEMMGVNASEAKGEFHHVLDLRKELAEITAETNAEEEDFYDVFTLQEWQNEAPFLDWAEFYNGVFSSSNFTISYHESIYVDDAKYFYRFGEVIEKYNKTEEGQKIFVNFVMWHLMLTLYDYLNDSYAVRGKHIAFSCLEETVEKFPAPMISMFVSQAFTENTQSQVRVMYKTIQYAYKNIIKNAVWMNARMQQKILERIDSIKELLGLPDYVLDDKIMDEDYKELTVDPARYYHNKLLIYEFEHLKIVKLFYERFLNKNSEEDLSNLFQPLTVEPAFYSRDLHLLSISAFIMQLPFYADDNTMSFNYGALGMIIGHELTHAIWSQKSNNWTTEGDNTTKQYFLSEKQCIMDQYTNYKINGMNLNGTTTWVENIADTNGLKASFYAYLDYSKKANVNYTLPGVDYNHRQQFFVSFAQTWCRSYKDDEIERALKTDEHSVSRYRVIGPLSNLKEFSREFNCPVGSKMNPEQKCLLW